MKKTFYICILLLIFSICLEGCSNYTEINNVTFATSIIFDKDDYDNIVLYLDCVSPYRSTNESSDKGRRIIFEGKGKTVLEAIRNISSQSSNRINYSQVKAYIFTEHTAVEGLQKFVDVIANNQELSLNPYIFIYYGDTKSLIETTNKDENYLGLYLYQLVETNKKNASVISSNVNDFINQSLSGNKISVVSAIELKEDVTDKKVRLNGGVIMQNKKLKEKIEKSDVFAYNLLTKRTDSGTFEVTNPNEKENFVTFDILNSKINNKISYNQGTIKLNKKVDIKISVGEVQGNFYFDKDTLQYMKAQQEERLQKFLEGFYNDYKKKDIDILNINKLTFQRYQNINLENYLNNSDIEVSVNLSIDGSSIIKDSL